MRNPATSQSKLTRFVLGLLAAFLCALPARAQFVGTAVTNINSPIGVAVDSDYNLYITYSNNIAKYVPSTGTLTTLAGSGNIATNNGLGTAAGFDQPWGIVSGAVGGTNGLIVTDYGSGLIRFVTYGGSVSTLAGIAFANGEVNGPVALATFSFPTGVAQDSAGNIYVADAQTGNVREIGTNNIVSTIASNFGRPTGLAVDTNNNVWVADAGNDVICMISNGVVTVMAGISGQPGTNDSLTATSARFRAPSGLLWLPNDSALYISDTGNDTIRSFFLTNGSYAVQTIAGLAGLAGSASGALSVAQFNLPIGLSVDPTDLGFYVADSANNAVRVLETTAPLPAVTPPVIGYVTFPADASPPGTSVFVPTTSAVFNNITNIAIEAEEGTATYISYGPTGSAIPPPGPATVSPPIYPGDGNDPQQISSAISPGPGTNDITVYAIGVESGRQSSPVVSARFQFITANPFINGDNAADILLTDVTAGANLYYTLNYGTNNASPTNDGSSLGPVSSGTTLSLNLTNNAVLEVRAFTPGLATSQIVSNLLSVSNVVGNQMTWGFASGLASTHYTTGRNITFSAPVTFTGIPSSLPIYTMQFDLTVTNNGPSPNPPPALSSANFIVHLLQPIIGEPGFYSLLPPGIFDDLTDTTNIGISATQPASLELAWLVTPSITNLYTSPNLIEYSGMDETLFTLQANGTLFGALQFPIPAKAVPGQPYVLQISYPSASSYDDPLCCGPPISVLVQAPTNGPSTGTSPNAVKLITVLPDNSPLSAHLVGDVFPYTWYNIGDFGDGLLQNDDVIQTMEYAFSHLSPYPANNPYYDAMDSSDGSVNTFYTASDSAIDLIASGDGVIDVSDVYVTLRRSLDPSISNYSRIWSGTSWVPMGYTNPVQQQVSAPRAITVAADQVQTGGSLTAQVPIRVLAADAIYPIRVTMLSVEIDPLDGSPAITAAASFSAVTNLGSPYATASQAVNQYGGAWLNSSVAGVSGTSVLGTLTVTLPPNVTANSAYLVHFNHFSASPNGIALFKTTIQDGLITVGNRADSSWHDGIPDTWRLLYFGTVSNILSAANADPDGDGANNWQEYIAGTNPLDAASVFAFASSAAPAGGQFTLQWPSVVNKTYTLQSSSSPAGGWTTIVSNLLGNSQPLQWTDTNASTGARFYRALVQ
jgi:hypothetical protein